MLAVLAAVLVTAGTTTGAALARSGASPIGTGVVVVNTNLSYEGGAAAGTGMVLTSSGEVLTNNHVIRGATALKITIPGTTHTYTAKVVGYDVSDDVAVIQAVGASNLKTVATGSSSKAAIGESVVAIGNAGGTGRLATVSGTITGLRKSITVDDGAAGERLSGLIETNAAIEPGDSGGPLFAAGQVIGMNTAGSSGFASGSGAVDAYAVPIDKALSIVKQIAAGKSSALVHVGGTAFLGIQASFGDRFSDASGAVVAGLVSGGPAESAGLAEGDVITAIDGRAVASPSSLTSILLTKKPGAKVSVTYGDQLGNTRTATVTLASGPPQ
jgi:S1-C subfamily serine protease